MIEELVRDIFQILIQRRVITLDPEINALAASVEQHVAAAGGTPTPGTVTPDQPQSDPTAQPEPATPPTAPETA